MKILKILLISLGAFITLFLAACFFMPKQLVAEVNYIYSAPKSQVYKAFYDLEVFNAFNAWMRIDPEKTKIVYGPKSGRDAWYTWENAKNNTVGKGKLLIKYANPEDYLEYHLFFMDEKTPSISTIKLVEKAGKTQLTWRLTGSEDTPFVFKIFNILFRSKLESQLSESCKNLDTLLDKLPKINPNQPIDSSPLSNTDILTISQAQRALVILQETSFSNTLEIQTTFQETLGLLYSYLTDQLHLTPKDFSYPVAIYKAYEEEEDVVQVYIGFIVNQEAQIPLDEGMEIIEIPSSKVVKKAVEGSYDQIRSWHEKMRTFVQDQKLASIYSPYEIYLGNAFTDTDISPLVEIYYPIR